MHVYQPRILLDCASVLPPTIARAVVPALCSVGRLVFYRCKFMMLPPCIVSISFSVPYVACIRGTASIHPCRHTCLPPATSNLLAHSETNARNIVNMSLYPLPSACPPNQRYWHRLCIFDRSLSEVGLEQAPESLQIVPTLSTLPRFS